MLGVEIAHCNAALEAVLTAYNAFLESTVEEALRPILAYGKSDTLGLDAMPEITIVEKLQTFDRYTIVITEERGSLEKFHFTQVDDPRRFRTIFISDPTDRSAQVKTLLEGVEDKTKRVGEIFRSNDIRAQWEEQFSGPAEITGGSSSITCVRRGIPIFTVMVNYVTQQLFVSCSAGNYCLELADVSDVFDVNLNCVRSHGSKLYFRGIRSKKHGDLRRFVTFMGKSGYKENFMDSNLMSEAEMDKSLVYRLPGGPLRVLYLSTLQPEDKSLGFIMANGEKVIEWIHWLPFIRFARTEDDLNGPALRLFEIYQDRPWTKDGILMSTPPAYSIFRPISEEDQRMVIDVGRFSSFPNPSKVRASLVVTPPENQWATRVANQYGYRSIELYSD